MITSRQVAKFAAHVSSRGSPPKSPKSPARPIPAKVIKHHIFEDVGYCRAAARQAGEVEKPWKPTAGAPLRRQRWKGILFQPWSGILSQTHSCMRTLWEAQADLFAFERMDRIRSKEVTGRDAARVAGWLRPVAVPAITASGNSKWLAGLYSFLMVRCDFSESQISSIPRSQSNLPLLVRRATKTHRVCSPEVAVWRNNG